MKTNNELNAEWIEACKVMQIINDRRITIYKEWKANMESVGHSFGDEFPLTQDFQPSMEYDLFGNLINEDPTINEE